MRVAFKIIGADELIGNLIKLSTREAKMAFKGAAREIANDIQLVAQQQTPVKTGFLRQSARNQILVTTNRYANAIIYYLAKYAIYVHEHTWKKHRTGSAKFLELAIYGEIKKVRGILVKYINKAFISVSSKK